MITRIPVLEGVIDRRILVNFTVEPSIACRIVPAPFRPKLYGGKAIAGICLIRLKHIRPKGFPGFLGIGSENAAHRIAVEWPENGTWKQGVYIPRRDSSSRFNHMAGERIFPGKHHLSTFTVQEKPGYYHISFHGPDKTAVLIEAKTTGTFSNHSIFENIAAASSFFECGTVGYSPDASENYEGVELKTFGWKVSPLEILSVKSSFFDNPHIFPTGSVRLDNALLMTHIRHEWRLAAGIKM